MRYVRHVDFKVFPEKLFHSHIIAHWDSGIESCAVILTRVPPGTATGANGVTLGSHTHEVDQFYFVLDGRMTVELGEEQYQATPGSIVQIPAGLPHWNWNAGDTDELHLEILAPSPMTYDFARAFKKGEDRQANSCKGEIRKVEFGLRAASSAPLVRVLANGDTGSESIAIDLVDQPVSAVCTPLTVSSVDHFYFVIEGRLGVQVGLERHEVGPHTLVVLPAGIAFSTWNAGDGPERHVHLRAPQHLTAGTLSATVHLD